MTNGELKGALIRGDEVIYQSDGFSAAMKLIGIIYRSDNNGGVTVQAELHDLKADSTLICSPKEIVPK